jgi:aldos-2-ulose dehydratase/isomerase family protein/VCBS repeat protein
MFSRLVRRFVACLLVLAPLLSFLPAAEESGGIPSFRVQEIEKSLGVGYAVLLVDVNNDGKKDIVVVDQTRVVWYENPSWRRRIMIEGQTKPDNVCIAAADIDGDGQLDFALGAAWNPSNTKSGGTLQWLRRGKTLDEPWSVHPIGEEPTLHRIRFADLDGDGKPVLLVVPLMGRDSTGAKNHMDGQPVRVLAYRIPKDPIRDRWPMEVIDQSMHVVHNFQAIPGDRGKGMDVLTAGYEGVSLLQRSGEKWARRNLGMGDQAHPDKSRGSSEIKRGKLKNGQPFIATIEPWHGDKVVVYTPPGGFIPPPPGGFWERQVLDDRLKWGHAVWCADLDGDGGDELIIGVRDVLSSKSGENCGVRIFKAQDEKGTKWERHLLDEGGVRVEDLAADDLDGDGRIDLVAVGRQSHNARIYWNKGAIRSGSK